VIALDSRRVVVTRPAAQSTEMWGLLEEAGAVPLLVPTIRIGPPSSFEPLDTALRSAADYDWWIFTSANAARAMLLRAATLELDFARVAHPRLAAVGPATEAVLADAGLSVAATPSHHRADQIPDVLGDLDGCRILLPRSDLADQSLPELLRERGARVDAVPAYRTELQPVTPAGLEEFGQGVDAITFTSPSTVRGLLEGLGSAYSKLVGDAVVASVGPVTSKAARALGVHVHGEASESTARGLVDALCSYEGWVKDQSMSKSS